MSSAAKPAAQALAVLLAGALGVSGLRHEPIPGLERCDSAPSACPEGLSCVRADGNNYRCMSYCAQFATKKQCENPNNHYYVNPAGNDARGDQAISGELWVSCCPLALLLTIVCMTYRKQPVHM